METTVSQSAGQYIAPDITVIDIELSQNILDASGMLPGIGDGGDAW
jgi:hypothetical protein